MVKYLVAPARMPDELTWFKWEAYATWLSGFALLVIVYYLGAELYLIDKSVLASSATSAAAVAFGSLLVAWLLYEVAVPLPAWAATRSRSRSSATCFWSRLTYAFTHVFSGRGAFNQIGALIGTIMVANVFVIIIPNQKQDRRRAARGQGAGPGARRAGQAALGAQQLSDACRSCS